MFTKALTSWFYAFWRCKNTKLLENTQIFLAEILENTQIFLAEILENTQIFYNIVVVLPTFWWHIADYLPRKSGSGVVAYVHLLIGQQVVAHLLRLIWQQPVAKLSKDDGTHTIGEVPAFWDFWNLTKTHTFCPGFYWCFEWGYDRQDYPLPHDHDQRFHRAGYLGGQQGSSFATSLWL